MKAGDSLRPGYKLEDLTSDDYKRVEWLPNNYKVAESIEYVAGVRSGHSQTGQLRFVWDEKHKDRKTAKLFVKQYFHSPESSTLYANIRDINSLFNRELRNSKRIHDNVGALVPSVKGYSVEDLVLCFEYVSGLSDRDRLLKAMTDENEDQRRALVYEGVRKIASFDGKVQARKQYFGLDLMEQRNTSEMQVGKLVDYLSKIVRYTYRLQGREIETLEQVKDVVREDKNVHLVDEVVKIVQLGEQFSLPQVLQHGDCRLQHVFGEKFVDLEQFGVHPQGYDLVTYLNAEGSIAQLSIRELPNLLGWFLAYERAAVRTSWRNNELKNLSKMSQEDVLQTVPIDERLRFMVGFLAMDIIENLHLDASNKTYKQEHLEELVSGIPNYDVKKMMNARVTHVSDVFSLVSDSYLLLEHLSTRKVVTEYFSAFAGLLQRLDVVDIPENVLGKLKV